MEKGASRLNKSIIQPVKRRKRVYKLEMWARVGKPFPGGALARNKETRLPCYCLVDDGY